MAEHQWLVVTGAASGIMEAGHVGAGRENSMGLNILLPFEQAANPIIAGDPKLVHMKYFFTRKLMFVKESDAICLLPGGFGTLDEGLEVLTLLQTGKRDMVPVVLLDEPGGDYWNELRAVHPPPIARPRHDRAPTTWDSSASPTASRRRWRRSWRSSASITACVTSTANWSSACFTAPSEELLAAINARFADILAAGQFTVGGPLPEERDEPALADLPRLICQFNRRNYGRLRQLIDCLNAGI